MSSSTRNSLIDLTLEDSDEEIGVNVVVTHPACTIDLLSPVPRNRTHKNDDLDSKHAGSNEFGSSQQSDSARSLFEMVTGKASTLKSKSTIDLVSPLNPNQAHNAADDDYTDPDLNSGPLGLSILDLLAIQERQHVVSQKTTASSIGTQVKTTHSQNTKRDTPHEGEVRSPFLDGNQKRQKSCYGDDAEDSSQRLEADDKSPQMMSTNEFDLPSLLQNVVSAKSTSSSQGHEALSTKTANPAKPRKKTKAINKSPQLAASNTLDNFLGIPPSTSAIPPAQSTAQPVPHSPTASALLQAGYEVVLFVDKREKSHDTIIASLLADKVRCELRTLAVGDFLWVARPPSVSSTSNFNDNPADTSSSAAENVYVLDCIAERKTIADLVSSVLDGRYKEQKTRLASLTIPHCFYIVEAEYMAVNPYMQVHCPSMGIESVKTAMVSTNMQDKMHVIRTKGGEHTVRTLVQITR
ncbi:hypothetical protein EON65_12445 [archaeon]|nr:MAG: hypothetical protein EON65_12445 [archaeon]